MRSWFTFTLSVLLVACQSPVSNSTATPTQNQESAVLSQETIILDDVSLRINKPDDWESIPLENGIVFGEHFSALGPDSTLDGLMTYVIVTPLENFDIGVGPSENFAKVIMDQSLADPNYTANITFTRPVGFEWNTYQAAYFLLSDTDDNVTMVICVVIPEDEILLTYAIAAPYDQRDRIPGILPLLLDGITLNNIVFETKGISALPEQLAFPKYDP